MKLVDADAELEKLKHTWFAQDERTGLAVQMYIKFLETAPEVSVSEIINEQNKNMRNSI